MYQEFATGKPLKTALTHLVQNHLNPDRPTFARFNGVDLTILPEAVTKDPEVVVAEIEAQYWQADAVRAAQKRQEYELAYAELRLRTAAGYQLDSDERMWVKNVEVILDIAPEESLLRK